MLPKMLKQPPGPKAKKILAQDSKLISPSLTREAPLVLDRAEGSNLWDVDGNCYIDFCAGVAVANVGHSNPLVTKAVETQLKKASHAAFSDFYSELPLKLAEKIKEVVPKKLDTFFFSNSGTEAVEAAMKLARWSQRRPFFLAFYGSFHGRTYGSLSLTQSKPVHKEGFGPFLSAIHAPYAYCYRCAYGKEPESCSMECVSYIEDSLLRKIVSPEDVCGVFVEPIQGEGGYIVPPKRFHVELRELCERHDILYIADEIQCGNFRTGKFLASELFGVIPDIVCMGKAIGGGLPIGITVANRKLMDWPPGAHANTFGGNLLACAAGIATLDFMVAKKLGIKAEKDGDHVLKRLREMQQKYNIIGDVRGKGLMAGIELVKDRETKEHAVEERKRIIDIAFNKGLVLLPAGTSVIRIAPPLTITREELDAGLDILDQAFAEV
jgi:4-aminobutyrate aminotransferase